MSSIIVIGAGPAGLSAAVYLARAGKETLVFDNGKSKMMQALEVHNYLGFPKGIEGEEFLRLARKQAQRFYAVIMPQEVLGVKRKDDKYIVQTKDSEYEAEGLIIATGTTYKDPDIPGVKEFTGKGVSYCVECDGFMFKGKKVVVIGGQDLAAKEALSLLDYTSEVSIYTNGSAPNISERFMNQMREKNILVRTDPISEVTGEKMVDSLVLESGERVPVNGVFIATGTSGAADFARELGIAVKDSFIVVDEKQRTDCPRVYAAGDCVGGNMQVAVAVGEGADAAINLLSELRGGKYVQWGKEAI